MTISPDVSSRMNNIRRKLEKSRAGATECLARFTAIEPQIKIELPLPSSSLRAMLARVKFERDGNQIISPLVGIHNPKIPQTVQ